MRRWWKVANFASAIALGVGYALGVLRPASPILLLLVLLPAALAVIGTSDGAPVGLLRAAVVLNLFAALFLAVGLGAALVSSLTGQFQPVLPLLVGLFALFSVNAAATRGLLAARVRG